MTNCQESIREFELRTSNAKNSQSKVSTIPVAKPTKQRRKSVGSTLSSGAGRETVLKAPKQRRKSVGSTLSSGAGHETVPKAPKQRRKSMYSSSTNNMNHTDDEIASEIAMSSQSDEIGMWNLYIYSNTRSVNENSYEFSKI